ncbi:MAG: 7-carboxy-7-deazaguanine synthase QueE [Bacteroidales bacterium]|nr:7-carboxy-7-deazaguanine synthase QueE [Bacteroidales bacterium]
MRYRVNEIFLSLQGEGFWTGTPMVFLRLSGCNLACPFCDTDFSAFTEMSASEVVDQVLALAGECRRVCITGGEPLLQLDSTLIDALHAAGFTLHLETNGTLKAPDGIDWITVSPKAGIALKQANELKLVFQKADEAFIDTFAGFPCQHRFLQPCDTGNPEKNAVIHKECVEYIKSHPWWRLSLQTHKLLGIR